jgi:hypothetical protein
MGNVTITITQEEWDRFKNLAENSAQLNEKAVIDDKYLRAFSESDYPELQLHIGEWNKSPEGIAYNTAIVKAYLKSIGIGEGIATTAPTMPTGPAAPNTPAPPINMLSSSALINGCTLTGQNTQQQEVSLTKNTKYVATIALKSNIGGGPCGFQMVKADGSGEFYTELKAGVTNTISFTATATESRKFTIQGNGGIAIFTTSSLQVAQ